MVVTVVGRAEEHEVFGGLRAAMLERSAVMDLQKLVVRATQAGTDLVRATVFVPGDHDVFDAGREGASRGGFPQGRCGRGQDFRVQAIERI